MVLRRPGGWRDIDPRGTSGDDGKKYRRRNRKHLRWGSSFNIAIFCVLLLCAGYLVIVKRIDRKNASPAKHISNPGQKMAKNVEHLLSMSDKKIPVNKWQTVSQTNSLSTLPIRAEKSQGVAIKKQTSKPLMKAIVDDAKNLKSAGALQTPDERHSWKTEKHPKHKEKIKKKNKDQRHISADEYKVMFQKAVLHRLPHGVKPDSERAKLVYDELEAIETRLRKFYEEVNPERIPTIPNIMKKYIFPGDHRSMSKLSERLQEVYGKPAIRKYFVQDTTSHSEEEYGQDQLKALQSTDLKLKLRLFFKHHDKFRIKDVDKIVGSGNETMTMYNLCKKVLLKTYSIVAIKKFFGVEEDWNQYDTEDHKKIEEVIASGVYKDEVPTEDQWMDTLKSNEKKLNAELGEGNYKVDWESTKRSLHEMYAFGKGNVGQSDDPDNPVEQRIHRHDYIHRHFDEAAQKGHLQQMRNRKVHIAELAEECTFWTNVTASPCHPLHPCQNVEEHTPTFYSKCFDRLGLKYCKQYGFVHGDPGCPLMFGTQSHKVDQYIEDALERKRIAKQEESKKQDAYRAMYRAPDEKEEKLAVAAGINRTPQEMEFMVKRLVDRMKRFYGRVKVLSPIAAKKAENTTNLLRIARLYVDSEELLFKRLRSKYGLSDIHRRRLLFLFLSSNDIDTKLFEGVIL